MAQAITEIQAQTRERLLEAAGPLFAERGLRGVTVKEICDAAGANIAAVNYHFGDKERLYAEVLRYAHRCATGRPFEAVDEELVEADPEAAFRAAIVRIVRGVFDPGKPAWYGRLMSREMIEPSGALDQLIEMEVRPKAQRMRGIIGKIVGLPPEHERVRRCLLSVMGQCMFLHQSRAAVTRLFPDLPYDPERIAEHVAAFSLGALRAIRDDAARSKRGKGRKR